MPISLLYCEGSSKSPSGIRFQYYLTFFAGKDLLYALAPYLQSLGFASPASFRRTVLKGIQRSAEVWRWLPEWAKLRDLVQSHIF